MDRVDGLGEVVTRQESTVAEYRKRIDMLTRRANAALGHTPTLLETITHLGDQHEEFKPATIRKYFAALTLALDEAVERGGLDGTCEQLCRKALARRPRPRSQKAEPQTSARKRKEVERSELHAVCVFMRSRGKPDDLLLVRLLAHGVLLALRPSEYADAALQGQLLIVHSRKTTNNRGLAAFRELDLAGISADEASSIDRLIEDFAKASQGELSKLLDRLGARLRRSCRRLGIQPFALYTARHQAIANLKAAGKSAAEIAAIAGHRSLLTQDKSYAPRRSGWKNVATIRATLEMQARLEPPAERFVPTVPKV